MWQSLLKNGYIQAKIYNRRKNGELYEEIIFIKTIKDKSNRILFFFSFFIDISDLKKAKEEVSYYIFHDNLTKLSNKESFLKQANGIIEKNESFALIYIDIDNYSQINAKFSIEKSDQLLKEFASFLKKELMDPKDVVSRFGSDEFILLKRGVIEQNLSKFVRNSVEKIREKSFFIDKTEIKLTISAGIVLYPRDYIEIEALINYAQASCKKVKDLGKNQCTFFNKEIYNNFLEEYTLDNEVSKGLEKEEFELYFQSRDTIHNLSLLILLRL